MRFCSIRSGFFIFSLILYSTQVFAISELDSTINDILSQETTSNSQQFQNIVSTLDSSTALTELEKSEYYHEIAKAFYKRQDYDIAIECLEKAIEIRNIYKDEEPELLKKSLFNLGLFHKKKDDLLNSHLTYKRLLSIGENDRYSAKVYALFGLHYTKTGDFAKGLEYFERARSYFTKHGLTRDLFLAHINTSFLYTQMGRIEYAKEIIKHLSSADSINTSHENSISKDNELFIINQRLGNLYLEQTAFDKAKQRLQRALEIATKQNDSVKLCLTYNSIGKSHFDLNEDAEALSSYTKAFKLTNDPYYKAIVHNNLGDFYKEKDFQQAEHHYLSAIANLSGEPTDHLVSKNDLENSSDKLDLFGYLKDIATFYSEYDKNEKALEAIQLVDYLIDITRLESTESTSKQFWRKHGSNLYMNGVKVAYKLNKPEIAFYFMEKNKVLLLLEDLTNQLAFYKTNIPDSIQIKEFNFISKIESQETKFRNAATTDKQKEKEALLALKLEYYEFLDALALDYPKYTELKKQVTIANLSEIENVLINNDTAIIEFIINENQGFSLFKSDTNIKLVQLDSITTINTSVNRLRKMMSKPFYNEADFSAFNEISYKLYTLLFSGINKEIENKKELIIIPDGKLFYLPFEVLQRDLSTNAFTPNYLLLDKVVSYGYSLSYLLQNKNLARSPKHNFYGVAPISFKNNLPDLDYSEKEMHEIQSILNGELVTSAQATKENFMNSLEDYKIIHIASHATLEEDNTSSLWLFDEKITLSELYTTKNQAELVVLSACRTSDGKLMSGEGLNSLSRGFFNSGSNSVLASLWDTNDKSNTNIMVQFYEHITNKQKKNNALTLAKRHYISNHHGTETSPYYWASNILLGSTDALELNNSSNKTLYIALFALLGVFSLIYVLKLK